MEQLKVITEITNDAVEFIQDYEKIVQSTETVIVQTEWNEEGDFFKKLTMYDNRYIQVPTLGSTTVIKELMGNA